MAINNINIQTNKYRIPARPRNKKYLYYPHSSGYNSTTYNQTQSGGGVSSEKNGEFISKEGDEIEDAGFTYSNGSILFGSTYKLNTAAGIRFTDDEENQKASIQYNEKKGVVVDSDFHPLYDQYDSKGFPIGEGKEMGDELNQWGGFYGQRVIIGNPGFGPEDDDAKGIGTKNGGISLAGPSTSIYGFGRGHATAYRPGLFIGSFWHTVADGSKGVTAGLLEAGDKPEDKYGVDGGTWKMFYRLHVGNPSGTGHYDEQHRFMVDNEYTIYGYHIASVKLTTQDLICTTIDKVHKLAVENVISKRITNENEIKSATITTTGLTSETITNTKGITSDTIKCKKLTSDSIVGTVTDPSDRNIKTVTGEIDKVDFGDIGTYKFFYNDDEKKNVKIGLMAQDVQAKYPEAVRDIDGNLGIMYNSLVALLVKDAQLKEKRIDELEKRISKLEKILNDGTT